jgi:hypothetical protein
MFIKKNLILNIYLGSNYVFTGYPGYLWTRQGDRVTLDQLLHGFFLLKKTLATPKKKFYLKEKLL